MKAKQNISIEIDPELKQTELRNNTMQCPSCGTSMDLEKESNVFICDNCHRALLNKNRID